MKYIFVGHIFFLTTNLLAQESIDSVKRLNEVVIKAYAYNRSISEVPGSVVSMDSTQLERFANTSLLPAVNMQPGIRMEERSSGSYRFSIRGSLLRSPFGVRNVKVYWNGLPLTDAGGNTYLNLLDYNSFGSVEIIKGPGASLYGAGTGGVLLINSPERNKSKVEASATGGSFGLQRYALNGTHANDRFNGNVRYAHHVADGYRTQTQFKRDAWNADVSFRVGAAGLLNATLFYSNLFYQTPGGLTEAQLEQDPTQARPPTATQPGAEEQAAAVYNKTFFGGLSYEQPWTSHITSKIGVYTSQTNFENPSIRNYEQRDELNFGGRAELYYETIKSNWNGKLSLGGEAQGMTAGIQVYNNNGGSPRAFQNEDDIDSSIGFIFFQGDISWNDFFLTAGLSTTFAKYDFNQTQQAPQQVREFDAEISPRIALLKKINSIVSLHGSWSKGFSPPTLSEVRPSTNEFNNTLNPENGTNIELGARINSKQIQVDFSLYHFKLEETIVIQRAADGAEYFVNAGGTTQPGSELMVSWIPLSGTDRTKFKSWLSYAYQPYVFDNYVQDGNDFSGNDLTGVARHVLSLGVDYEFQKKLYINLSGQYVDKTSLNDGNTSYASEYFLVGFRSGYKVNFQSRNLLELFAGVENLLNEKYSLGNDLNAFGGRYFNAAPTRNYYAGLKIKLTR